MCKISIVMPVYNTEMYVKEAIESVLNQSFEDFEFIIIDDGSTDNTCSIIQSFDDKRIKLIQNKHDFMDSLNLGMSSATGKYIARMDADDIMHVDRLKVQYSIMECETSVTVCGTEIICFGAQSRSENIPILSGLVEYPLLKLIQRCFLFHPTTMIRADFLRKHKLKYEYLYAEDFKLWVEIAKLGGQFYIDNQPLLYYRISDNQVSNQKKEDQNIATEMIINEIIEYLIYQNKSKHSELPVMYNSLCRLQEKGLITKHEISVFFQNLFSNNKEKFII